MRVSWIIIIALGIIEIIFMSIFIADIEKSRYYKEKLSSISTKLINCNDREFNRKFNDYRRINTDNTYLNSIQICDLDGNKHKLTDNIKGNTLIYRFFQESCPPCVEQNLKILNELCDSVESSKILAISNYNNIKQLRIFARTKNLKFEMYSYPEKFNLFMEIDTLSHDPYYIYVSEDLRVSMGYFAQPEDSITSPYFIRISELLK